MISSSLPSYDELCRQAGARVEAAVFGAESFNGLAVLRSLGRHGVPVTSVAGDPHAIGFASRFTKHRLIVPDLTADPDGFIAQVRTCGEQMKARGARLVAVPTSDRHIELLSDRRADLEGVVDLLLPSPECLRKCLDKLEQYELSEQIGVPYPRTYSNGEEARLAADLDAGRLEAPFMCKARSNLPNEALTLQFRRLLLHDRASLEKHLQAAQAQDVRYVVQEMIPGGDDELYTLGVSMDREGRVLAAFTGRKLRQMPPRFGICRVGECRVVPEVLALGVKLLRALNFCGIAQVEFKRDPRDGTYRLMEVNPRSWAWIGLPLALGCDLVYSHVCAAVGVPLPENESLPSQRALWISLSHDLEWSLVARDGAPWAPVFKGYEKIVEAYFATDDLRPGLRHTRRFLADYAARGWAKLRRRA